MAASCQAAFAWWKRDGQQSMLANWVSVKWIQTFSSPNQTSKTSFIWVMVKFTFVLVHVQQIIITV